MPQVAVTWLIEGSCFYPSLVQVDSEVLRNRHLRQAANRYGQQGRVKMPVKESALSKKNKRQNKLFRIIKIAGEKFDLTTPENKVGQNIIIKKMKKTIYLFGLLDRKSVV